MHYEVVYCIGWPVGGELMETMQCLIIHLSLRKRVVSTRDI